MRLLKAVYLEDENGNSIFVNLEDGLPFTGSVPEKKLYGENGKTQIRIIQKNTGISSKNINWRHNIVFKNSFEFYLWEIL